MEDSLTIQVLSWSTTDTAAPCPDIPDEPVIKRREWELTQQSFELLLARLDPDRELAAEKYEMVRRKLIKFFGWWGSDSPEDHADETIDRLVRKLSEGEEIDSIDGYVCGVARLVFREYVTKQTKRRRAFEQATRSQVLVEDQIEREARLECYDHCLESLPPESRLLLKRYYQEDSDNKAEQRRALADELGIPMNLLRIRAFRIRKQLRYCLNECLKRRLLEM